MNDNRQSFIKFIFSCYNRDRAEGSYCAKCGMSHTITEEALEKYYKEFLAKNGKQSL